MQLHLFVTNGRIQPYMGPASLGKQHTEYK